MRLQEKKERFMQANLNKDYLLFKMPVRHRVDKVSEPKIEMQLTALYANSSFDLNVTLRQLYSKKATILHGNFPNLYDRNNKINERVAHLKNEYDRFMEMQSAIEAQRAMMEASIEKPEAKKEQKQKEIKERLEEAKDEGKN